MFLTHTTCVMVVDGWLKAAKDNVQLLLLRMSIYRGNYNYFWHHYDDDVASIFRLLWPSILHIVLRVSKIHPNLKHY